MSVPDLEDLRSLKPLEIEKGISIGALLRRLEGTAFGGRAIGHALGVLSEMIEDRECAVVLTVSGAMTVAKMSSVLATLLERRWVNFMVTTGAVVTHSVAEDIGSGHFRCDPDQSDEELRRRGLNRILDVLEPESNLNKVENLVLELMTATDPTSIRSSAELIRALGRRLAELGHRGLLAKAFEASVPIYVPALTDSELGMDVALWQMLEGGRYSSIEEALDSAPPDVNNFRDLKDFASRIVPYKRLGIFTIGGGVPRNWAQQVTLFLESVGNRLGFDLEVPEYMYGVRVCPEPASLGGLSGCSYSEGVSWGKFRSLRDGGKFAEVFCDATIAVPFLVAGLLEELA